MASHLGFWVVHSMHCPYGNEATYALFSTHLVHGRYAQRAGTGSEYVGGGANSEGYYLWQIFGIQGSIDR